MAQNEVIIETFNQYKIIITNFPIKSKMYLSLLIGVLDVQTYIQIPKHIRKNYQTFTDIFKKLDANERVYFIKHCIDYILARIKDVQMVKNIQISNIQTTCEIKTSFIGMSYWQKKNFIFQINNFLIKLLYPKKPDMFIDLKSYLIRKSQSQKNSLVLESFDGKVGQKLAKITIKFNNISIYEEIYNNIRESIIEMERRRLQLLLTEDLQETSRQSRSQKDTLAKGLTFLTHKNINEYFDQKQALLQKLKNGQQKVFSIYNEKGIKITNSTLSSKLYYMQYMLPQHLNTLESIKNSINILSSKNIPNNYHCQRLESFTQNINANYYKLFIEKFQCQFIMIVEKLEKENTLQQTMKAIENMFHGVSIPFMNIEIKQGKNKRFFLNLQAIIKYQAQKKKNKSREISKILINMISKESLEDMNHESLNQSNVIDKNRTHFEFSIKKRKASLDKIKEINEFSITGNVAQLKSDLKFASKEQSSEQNQKDDDDDIFYTIVDLEQPESNREVQNILNQISYRQDHLQAVHKVISQPDNIRIHKYLTTKHNQEPISNYPKKLITEHFLSDWKKLEKGGVVCINQEVVNEQKRIIRLIFNQIIKMKGIMNFSLPIQICKPQSALVSIARNLSYAPMLFDNFINQTPIQRMKKIVIFQISMSALSLCTQKPFNPILGQTYQGSINGCPIYMQQISHHPPLSSIYFVGRGYKIYGVVAPQVNLRVNHVKGINNRWLTILHDNGELVEFNLPIIIINGTIIGDRSIYFQGTNYIVDPTNLLIVQINYHASNNSIFKSKQSPDYLVGVIYQVTPTFLQKFYKSGKQTSPKKDQNNKILLKFDGQWNGILTMNNADVFNYFTNFPFLMENYQFHLPSDSTNRTDVNKLINGVIDKAQQQKELLEKLQRNDQRLRVQHQKNEKKK